MPVYRLYLMDADNHVKGVRELDCPDDEAAIADALKVKHPYILELWHLGRRVKVFEPASSSSRLVSSSSR